MNVWLVGQRSDITGETVQWTVGGIFESEAEAVAACRDWTYFVMGPITIGVQAPHEPCETEKGYYPTTDGRPEGFQDPLNAVASLPPPWKEGDS